MNDTLWTVILACFAVVSVLFTLVLFAAFVSAVTESTWKILVRLWKWLVDAPPLGKPEPAKDDVTWCYAVKIGPGGPADCEQVKAEAKPKTRAGKKR